MFSLRYDKKTTQDFEWTRPASERARIYPSTDWRVAATFTKIADKTEEKIDSNIYFSTERIKAIVTYDKRDKFDSVVSCKGWGLLKDWLVENNIFFNDIVKQASAYLRWITKLDHLNRFVNYRIYVYYRISTFWEYCYTYILYDIDLKNARKHI